MSAHPIHWGMVLSSIEGESCTRSSVLTQLGRRCALLPVQVQALVILTHMADMLFGSLGIL